MPPALALGPQSEEEVVGVVREAQASLRVIDADNIDEMADDILAEEEADDLLEGEGPRGRVCLCCWMLAAVGLRLRCRLAPALLVACLREDPSGVRSLRWSRDGSLLALWTPVMRLSCP